MNKLIHFIFLFFVAPIAIYGQSVIENIAFDNYVSPVDNDFANYFSVGTGLTQITTNGIVGGCLTTPLTVNWGNDNAIYCSKYIDSASYSNTTRISFKYDTTQINTVNYDRAVSIFLRPSADFNHYVIASIMHDKKIQIVSYFAANNPFPVTLQHNHWYEFILNTSYTTPAPIYQVTTNAQLNDLGLTGLTPPIPAGFTNLSFTDSLLYVDDEVQVSFTGSMWGGAKYLDNFGFQGVKSANSCSFTSGIPVVSDPEIDVFFHDNAFHFTNSASDLNWQLYSVTGQKAASGKVPSGVSSYHATSLENGLYLLEVTNTTGAVHLIEKVVISNK